MDQLIFLDKFVRIYGIKGLNDYETEITTSQYKNTEKLIQRINQQIPQLKKLFKTSQLNLSRKSYKVDNINLAFSLLRKILQQCQIPFDVRHTSKCNYLRLIPINNLLVKYIDQKMNDIIHDDSQIEINYEKPNPKEIDYQKDVIEKTLPKYIVDKTLLPDGYPAKSCSPLYTLTTNKNKNLAVIEKFKKLIEIDDEIMITDEYIVKEVSILRLGDLIQDIKYKIYDEDYLLCDTNEYIKKVWLVAGNNVITKDITTLQAYQGSFPIVSCAYQLVRLIFFIDKKHLNELQNKNLYCSICYAYLNDDSRKSLLGNEVKYNQTLIKNGCLMGSHDQYRTNQFDNVFYLNSKRKHRFLFERYNDLVYDIEVSLVDSQEKEIDGDILYNLEIGGNVFFYNLKHFTENNPLPLGFLYYHECRLNIETNIKDCFIRIKFKTLNLNQETIDKLKETPFYIGKDPYALIKGGMGLGYNEEMIKKNQIPHYSELSK